LKNVTDTAREEGKEEGLEEGIEKGKEAGKAEERRENARKMKQLGIEVEIIMQVTGLSREEVESV
jgi:predicted transposase/invertase (TIGR01784 family)